MAWFTDEEEMKLKNAQMQSQVARNKEDQKKLELEERLRALNENMKRIQEEQAAVEKELSLKDYLLKKKP